MVTKEELKKHARNENLDVNTIEKDYMIGWLLAGIYNNESIQNSWLFKGGTCLKKCYFKHYRFSEDLDFTLKHNNHINTIFLEENFKNISSWIYEQCGAEILPNKQKFEIYKNTRGHNSVLGKIYYVGPMRRQRNTPCIKLNLTADEIIVFPPSQTPIYHPYQDNYNNDTTALSYNLEEIFAEKLRALGDRMLPRDLYDVIELYCNEDLIPKRNDLLKCLRKKCEFKKIPLPTYELLNGKPEKAELISEWNIMLAHQINSLKPFDYYWSKLPEVLNWVLCEQIK